MHINSGLHGAHLKHVLVEAFGVYEIRAKLNNGFFVHFSKEVLVERHRAADFLTRAAAAILHAGPPAALSSHTSARLYGCEAADDAPIHVLLPYRRRLRSREGMAVHHSGMAAWRVETVHGLPVLALEYSLAEMLCRARPAGAFACLEQALAMQKDEARERFRDLVAECVLARLDKRGYRRAKMLLELATGLTESPAEGWLLVQLADAGIPEPVPQFAVVGIDGRERYRLDFAWPDLRVALEYDGYAAHEGRESRDLEREQDLVRRGWIVVRATVADLKDPIRLIAEIRQAFLRRRVAV
ncbi:DUF559 domain-containing protein [Kibdelosporangium philippinense]|uniref:DUF559 domain-containing protein n=1 Tax=Kibdelosporangium philippinense TaxID=211113 RepID=A0ABS8ZGV8_9PSEU|nr:DUF559 domain-containing protein [Kibdelosporangium philippinense]MCE7006130.1 DUF559 domain-containing protein [Kibdelosporangium philippinense]